MFEWRFCLSHLIYSLFLPSLLPYLSLLLCIHLYIGTKSVGLVIGNIETEWLRILLPTESTLLQSGVCFFLFSITKTEFAAKQHSFLLFCFFSENLGSFSRVIFKTSFIFSNHFLSKCSLLSGLIFTDKEVANSDYRSQ